MVRYLPFLISLVLSVYALFSCIQTRDEDVPHLPKLVWIVLIVFVPFVGPIVWLLMARRGGAARRAPVVPREQPPSRPLAPDDDPDFLASLDRFRDPRTTVRPPDPHEDPADTPDEDKPTARDKLAERDKLADRDKKADRDKLADRDKKAERDKLAEQDEKPPADEPKDD